MAAVLVCGACTNGDGGQSVDAPTTTTSVRGSDGSVRDGSSPQDSVSRAPASVSAAVWAGGFCRAFQTWLDAVATASEGLNATIVPGDLAAARTAIAELFHDVADRTTVLVEQLEDSPVPDVDGGERLVREMAAMFEDVRGAFDTAGDQARKADIADPASFQSEVTELVGAFQRQIETMTEAFGTLDERFPDPELKESINSACSFG